MHSKFGRGLDGNRRRYGDVSSSKRFSQKAPQLICIFSCYRASFQAPVVISSRANEKGLTWSKKHAQRSSRLHHVKRIYSRWEVDPDIHAVSSTPSPTANRGQIL